MKIIDTIQAHLKQKLPFVAYRKPNAKLVSGFFQKSRKLYYTEGYTESGFVFAPFDHNGHTVLIPESDSDFISESYESICEDFKPTSYDSQDASENAHIGLVSKAIQEIKETETQKIVISRKEKINVQNIDFINVFRRLLESYPAAMTYMWFHPETGLWIGATPETLVKIENGMFYTMSLAATRPYEGTLEVEWNDKEYKEQSLVTDYIAERLQNVSSNFQIHDRETIQAGNVVHLRTLLTGQISDEPIGVRAVIEALHPTPAVCGMPRAAATAFILKEEGYDRKYYTGFLGEINKDNRSELFVNLRCMEVEDTAVYIYVGGGITEASIPEKEWEETKLKTRTLKNVL